MGSKETARLLREFPLRWLECAGILPRSAGNARNIVDWASMTRTRRTRDDLRLSSGCTGPPEGCDLPSSGVRLELVLTRTRVGCCCAREPGLASGASPCRLPPDSGILLEGVHAVVTRGWPIGVSPQQGRSSHHASLVLRVQGIPPRVHCALDVVASRALRPLWRIDDGLRTHAK